MSEICGPVLAILCDFVYSHPVTVANYPVTVQPMRWISFKACVPCSLVLRKSEGVVVFLNSVLGHQIALFWLIAVAVIDLCY
jgi:hypothetical protein